MSEFYSADEMEGHMGHLTRLMGTLNDVKLEMEASQWPVPD
jgi:hypothetical protein